MRPGLQQASVLLSLAATASRETRATANAENMKQGHELTCDN